MTYCSLVLIPRWILFDTLSLNFTLFYIWSLLIDICVLEIFFHLLKPQVHCIVNNIDWAPLEYSTGYLKLRMREIHLSYAGKSKVFAGCRNHSISKPIGLRMDQTRFQKLLPEKLFLGYTGLILSCETALVWGDQKAARGIASLKWSLSGKQNEMRESFVQHCLRYI